MACENQVPSNTVEKSSSRECSLEARLEVDLLRMGPRLQDATRKKRHKLSTDDYEKLVAYVEDPDNLHGSRRKTRIGGGKCQTKATAFNVMAAKLSGINGFPTVTSDELKKRFTCYVEMFKKAKELQDSTGGGLSEEEIAAGFTLEAKLNTKCPHFHRMNAVFGSRALNIDPPAIASLGLSNANDIRGADSQRPRSQSPEETITMEDYGVHHAEYTDFGERSYNDEVGFEVDDEPELPSPQPRTNENHQAGAEDTDLDLNVPHDLGRRRSTDVERVGEKARPATKNGRGNLLNLYEDSLKDKSEYRKDLLDYRRAALKEKKRARECSLEEKKLTRESANDRRG